jgi:hypothetical protein
VEPGFEQLGFSLTPAVWISADPQPAFSLLSVWPELAEADPKGYYPNSDTRSDCSSLGDRRQ